MVFVKLMGGLGNQMFQYAAGLALARRTGASLRLDTSLLANGSGETRGGRRTFELHRFRISAKVASPTELAEATGRPAAGWRGRVLGLRRRAGLASAQPPVLRERHFHFDPLFLDAPGHVCLVGYWQSARYFEAVRNVLPREFEVKSGLAGKNREVADLIRSVPSVSVHVRRGDYLSRESTYLVHGVCERAYYEECFREMERRVPGAAFFVFSDDVAWVRDHLGLPARTTVIDHNPPEMAHEDMRLMSMCRHNIIANSSFSWWGAWLNANPGKVVLAPRRWFLDPSFDTSDLLPEGWIRV